MQIETTRKKGIKTRILRLAAFLGINVPVVFVVSSKPKIKIVRRKLK